jgi:hypothetical protein
MSIVSSSIDKAASSSQPLIIVSTNSPALLEQQVARLRNQNELLIAQSMELRSRIEVLQAGVQLFSSMDQPPQASLIRRSSSSRRKTLTFGSSRSFSRHPVRSASLRSISPDKGVPSAGDIDRRGTITYPLSELGPEIPRSGDDDVPYSYTEPVIQETVSRFLGAAEELRLMMENQAAWLADMIDARCSVTPHTSPNHDGEPEETGIDAPVFFRCGICLEERPEFEEDLARIDLCEHAFCLPCLREYISSQVKEHRYPIFCPTCKANQATDVELQST